ncbi:hypothetical protein BDY19DRAFT_942442, partial [Irpex rosettiformis]
ELQVSYVGPIKPGDFISKFMPVKNVAALEKFESISKNVYFELPSRVNKAAALEKKLYEVFNEAVKRHELSPNFPLHISADGVQKFKDVGYRPDGGFEELPRAKDPRPLKTRSRKTRGVKQNIPIKDPDPEEDRWKTTDDDRREFDWSSDGLSVEFKRTSAMDPFYTEARINAIVAARKPPTANPPTANPPTDNPPDNRCAPFERPEEEHVITRGQLAIYATHTFAHQHRIHLFQLLVCGPCARFIFWDHSGAIVSHSFDYTANPKLLAQFIWYYNYMEDHDRGLDTSACVGSDDEHLQFEKAVNRFLDDMNDPNNSQRRLPHAKDTLEGAYHVYRVTVYDDETGDQVKVLIRRPLFAHHTAIGRGTRGYLAYHIDLETLKFLKDTRRVVHDRLIPERTLLRMLSESKVPFLPSVICGGDVPDPQSGGKVLTKFSEWVKNHLDLSLKVGFADSRTFCQHRLLEDIAYPLESAENSKEIVVALLDVFISMGVARGALKILHRDISVGNIMLSKNEKRDIGILGDWDHSGFEKPDSKTGHQRFRT